MFRIRLFQCRTGALAERSRRKKLLFGGQTVSFAERAFVFDDLGDVGKTPSALRPLSATTENIGHRLRIIARGGGEVAVFQCVTNANVHARAHSIWSRRTARANEVRLRRVEETTFCNCDWFAPYKWTF